MPRIDTGVACHLMSGYQMANHSVADRSARTRSNNRLAQKRLRAKRKNGYVPESGGKRGRPKKPGSYRTSSEFILFLVFELE